MTPIPTIANVCNNTYSIKTKRMTSWSSEALIFMPGCATGNIEEKSALLICDCEQENVP